MYQFDAWSIFMIGNLYQMLFTVDLFLGLFPLVEILSCVMPEWYGIQVLFWYTKMLRTDIDLVPLLRGTGVDRVGTNILESTMWMFIGFLIILLSLHLSSEIGKTTNWCCAYGTLSDQNFVPQDWRQLALLHSCYTLCSPRRASPALWWSCRSQLHLLSRLTFF